MFAGLLLRRRRPTWGDPGRSGAIRGDPGRSRARSGMDPGRSGAIRGDPGRSGAIRGDLGRSGAIRGDPGRSGAIRGRSGAIQSPHGPQKFNPKVVADRKNQKSSVQKSSRTAKIKSRRYCFVTSEGPRAATELSLGASKSSRRDLSIPHGPEA